MAWGIFFLKNFFFFFFGCSLGPVMCDETHICSVHNPPWCVIWTSSRNGTVSVSPTPSQRRHSKYPVEVALAAGMVTVNHQIIYHLQDMLNLSSDLLDSSMARAFRIHWVWMIILIGATQCWWMGHKMCLFFFSSLSYMHQLCVKPW